ncbi:MAG: hypothetical protein ACHQ1H_10910 [Nitrososphaerales archaeon]
MVLTKTFLAKTPQTGTSTPDVYTQFIVEVSDLHKKLHFRKLIVDSTGIGSPIVEHCRELKLPVQGMNLSRGKQEELFSNLKILLEQSKIVLPDNLDLLSSLNCITARRNRIGGYVFDHGKGTHDDLAYALALAVWSAGSGSVIVMNVT